MPRQSKEDILRSIDFAAFYGKAIKDLRHINGEQYNGKCPFHEDNTASFTVNLSNGLWQCKAGCGEGDVFHYAGKLSNLNPKTQFPEVLKYVASEIGLDVENPKPIPPKPKPKEESNSQKSAEPIPRSVVDKFKSNLTADLKQKLAIKRGLSECTLDRFEVGYFPERQRYTIPVKNEKGEIVCIRLYSPDSDWKMINYTEQRGDKVITWTDKKYLLGLPEILATNPQQIIICEGEFDCMMLWEKGFPAVTGITGGSAWANEWEHLLKDKDVILLYDCDQPGRKYGIKHGTKLKSKKIAKSVKICTLPLPGTKQDKDVTDWFAKDKKTVEELKAVIDNAPDAPDPAPESEPEISHEDNIEPPKPPGDDTPPDNEDGEDRPKKKKGKKGKDEDELCAADLSDMFLESVFCRNQHGELLFRKWREEYYEYRGKSFKRVNINSVRSSVLAFIQTVNKFKATRNIAYDVIANFDGAIEIPSDLQLPISDLDENPRTQVGLISMSNGFFDLEKYTRGEPVEIIQHSAKIFSTNNLPYDYIPGASCPTWERFLGEILPNSDVRSLLQEYCGYMLADPLGINYQKFLFCIGKGRNGKSTFLDAIREMCGGRENVSSVSLSEFGDKFKMASMIDKIANISGEMGDIEKIPEERLKAVIGGDHIEVEKKFKDSQSMRLTSKMMFSANDVPRFRDRTLGLWRKLLVVEFSVTIPEGSEDSRLSIKLKDEISGIFNWALVGLKRLVERGRFEEPESCTRAKEDISTETSTARRFLKENYIYDASSAENVTCLELYKKYSEWCRERGLKPYGDAQFGKEVTNLFGTQRARVRINGQRVYVYAGLIGIDVSDELPEPENFPSFLPNEER